MLHFLREIYPFSDFSDAMLQELFEHMHALEFQKGHIFKAEFGVPYAVFFICVGSVGQYNRRNGSVALVNTFSDKCLIGEPFL